MSSKVRSSKFRHVFGTAYKRDTCYEDLRIAAAIQDASDFLATSPLYVAFPGDSGGGLSACVLPWTAVGKYDAKKGFMCNGHTGIIHDLEFSPFNDSLFATVAEDGTGKIWNIPGGAPMEAGLSPVQNLSGHRKKVTTVKFNPIANNIVATSSADCTVKIWDIERGTCAYTLDGEHSQLINSCVWNDNGNLLATICKEGKLRIIDPRTSTVVSTVTAHLNAKKSRCLFLGNKVFTCGVISQRDYALFDLASVSTPLISQNLDSASGLIMPYWDGDTSMLYLVGKGDSTIRYYEIANDSQHIHYLSEYKSASPQKGMGWLPKRAVNVSDCEIARMFKVEKNRIEPITFVVPRKSEIFQDDLYPDCFSGEYTLTSSQWLSGSTGEPKKMKMGGTFVAKAPTEVHFDMKETPKAMSEKEMKDEIARLTSRVGYLEAEISKRDAKIKELEGK